MILVIIKILIGVLLLAVGSILLYSISRRLLSKEKQPFIRIETILEDLIFGSVLLASLTAYIFVGFKTTFLIVPFILFFYIRQSDKSAKVLVSKTALVVFLVVSILFGFLNVYGSAYSNLCVPEGDKLFYIHSIIGIEKFGNENVLGITQFIKPATSFQPYHYYELYLSLFIKKFTSFNYSLILNGALVSFFYIYY